MLSQDFNNSSEEKFVPILPVYGFEDKKYKVSNFGNVIDEDNNPVEILVNSEGNPYIEYSRPELVRTHCIADLVAEAFCPSRTLASRSCLGTAHLIRHLDGDKKNNRLSNLKMLTIYEYHKMYPGKDIYQSKTRGVFYSRMSKKWYTELCTPERDILIGEYMTEDEAIKVFNY